MGKTEEDDIDALFQLTPPEFVTARNALATQLKKAGQDDVASRVKALPKPSISAWTVNQLYWKHRAAFEKLLANGERFRQAQVSRLAGKGTDIHKLLNERREELSAMSRLAAEILQRSSGAAPSGVMRRITATLEALSAYGTLAGAPSAGRLVEDVDPPGFDALAALVPRVGDGSRAVAPSKVLTFQKEAKTPKGKSKSVDNEKVREQKKKEQLKAARDAKQEATRELVSAKRVALQAQNALKKAAIAREGNRRDDGRNRGAPAEGCRDRTRGTTESAASRCRSRVRGAGCRRGGTGAGARDARAVRARRRVKLCEGV